MLDMGCTRILQWHTLEIERSNSVLIFSWGEGSRVARRQKSNRKIEGELQ